MRKSLKNLLSTALLAATCPVATAAPADNNNDGLYRQAEAWYFGLNSVANADLAAKQWSKLAEKGQVTAQLKLGYYYWSIRERGQALKYFEQASQNGSGEADYQIHLITQDDAPLQRAIARQYPQAVFMNLVTLLHNAKLPQDRRDTAQKMRDLAAAYPQVCFFLGKYAAATTAEKIQYWQLGAAQGDLDCRLSLCEIYLADQNWPELKKYWTPPYTRSWTVLDKQIYLALKKISAADSNTADNAVNYALPELP